jgi:hypothetical protein
MAISFFKHLPQVYNSGENGDGAKADLGTLSCADTL